MWQTLGLDTAYSGYAAREPSKSLRPVPFDPNHRPTPRLPKELLRFVETQALNGYMPAQLALGDMYRTGQLGVAEDRERAKRWYRIASSAGSAEAQKRIEDMGLREARHDPAPEPAAPAAHVSPAAAMPPPTQSVQAGSDPIDLAVDQHEERFRLDPTQPASLHELFRAHLARGTRDAAWCVASVLVAMLAADDEERRFHDEFRPTGLPAVKGRLDDATWRERLFTPEMNAVVTKIFEAIAPAALASKLAHARMKSKPSALMGAYAQDPRTSKLVFAQLFGWAAPVLGVTAPQLYASTALEDGLVDLLYEKPIVLAGTKVLTDPLTRATFTCGRHLARYRPELFIRTLHPTTSELQIVFLAAIKLGMPSWSPPTNQQIVSATTAAFGPNLTPVDAERLRYAVRAFFDEGAKVKLELWSQSLEQTAIRAGLVLSGNLELARTVLEAETPWAGMPTAADKLRDLFVYAISTQYLEARKVLGVALPERQGSV